jgi:hypothetical protein
VAGRFINTDRGGVLTQTSITNSITTAVKNILNNPYYLYSDKRASKCTYFNINTTMTTLDEATRGNYGEISPDSPLRYNRVYDFYIYGISKIEPNLDVGDYGIEGATVTGDAIILPYTLIPYPGDYFILDQIDSDRPLMFKVTGVDPSSLDTGAIMYKVSYALDSSDGMENIEPQVVKNLRFFIQNMGTNFATFMEEDTYADAQSMEAYSTMLKDYYISLFYDAKIQSFSYNYSNNGTIGGSMPNKYGYHEFMGFKVYDPYLIEFMIRNKIISGSTNYIFVSHQMVMPVTFPIDYDRTFFSALENQDITTHKGTYVGNMLRCDQVLSLLYAYPIDYYYMEYRTLEAGLFMINIFDDPEFADIIKANGQRPNDPNWVMKNIIIKFFNKIDITLDDLADLSHLDYLQTKELFYLIPMVIFCIDKTLETMMSKTSS